MFDSTFVNKAVLGKLLTANNNGWKLDLFVSIDNDYICPQCQNICKNAVSLICETETGEDEHKDEDIKLYCESCMKTVISYNSNKCPISDHSNPRYASSRIPRKQIMKAQVLCPNSLQYQQKRKEAENIGNSNKNVNDDNFMTGNFYTTNEGNMSKNMDGQECCFEGTLGALIEIHIHECIKVEQLLQAQGNINVNKTNANQMRLYMIEDLQEKNIQMKKEIECLKNDLQNEIIKNVESREILRNQTQMNEVNIEALKKENIQISLEMETLKNEFEKLQEMIGNMKMSAEMNDDNINKNYNKKVELSLKTLNIPLSIHSYRKIYREQEFGDKYHPSNLLQPGSTVSYASTLLDEFDYNEKDWIIFGVNDSGLNYKQLFIPTQIKIRNYIGKHAVKSMEVWMGSMKSNEWRKLHSRNAICDIQVQNKSLQSFELDCYQSLVSVICQEKWRQIKVQFVENNGTTDRSGCKFLCYEIQLHGKIISM